MAIAKVVLNVISLVLVASTISLRADVPNVFESGKPAKASEVNENFSALVEDIQAITAPEKKYSIISSETLDNGLVRTKLYAYEESHFAGDVYLNDAAGLEMLTPNSIIVSEGTERIVNALGEFQGRYKYFGYINSTYDSSDDSEFAPVTCPDGSPLPRNNALIRYSHTLVNSRGTFSFSNLGSANAGVYIGCTDYAETHGSSNIEYYYLEGSGSGAYSCVSRVAYYGAFNGGGQAGWSKAYSPSRNQFPYAVSGIFDRSSNGDWGSYYLEIDAPADCLDL